MTSTVAASCAITAGWRRSWLSTETPSRIRLVTVAAYASAGSGESWLKCEP